MLPNSNLLSCNFTTHSIPLLPFKSPSLYHYKPSFLVNYNLQMTLLSPFRDMGTSQICVKTPIKFKPNILVNNNTHRSLLSPFRDMGTSQTCLKTPIKYKPNILVNYNTQRSLLSSFRDMGTSQICLNTPFKYKLNILVNNNHQRSLLFPFRDMGTSQICVKSPFSDDPFVQIDENDVNFDGGGNGGGDWITSFLLFLFWAALLYYVFTLSPNQTPLRDIYFVKKLCNLAGDDGFRMNQVLVSLWYIMGLWPIVYCMLLLPSGRSSKGKIPVWPFLTLSFFGGAYALIPYFILWRPPPPPIEEEEELSKWPLNFLESKITAGFLGIAGLGLIVYAALATGDWNEFYQYFRESKLVHATTVDFSLLSAFAPFWVYNDMTVRKCYDKTAWLLPLSVVPFLGPVLYILLRPPLRTMPVSIESTMKSD